MPQNKTGFRGTEEDRFWRKVRISSKNFYNGTPCWQWTAALTWGYGVFGLATEVKYKYVNIRAHRWAYEYLVGGIPDGRELDHLCRNRWCVNPLHLEPVTRLAHIFRSRNEGSINAAKTECKRGHPFIDGNFYTNGRNERICRLCRRMRKAGLI